MATLVFTRVGDPREYGLVNFDENGTVTGFIEKPGWNQAVTNAANTGIYILSSECINMIPDAEVFDFAKDLFPLMLKQGKKICCFETDDNWYDIGDIDTYISCQADMMSGKIKTKLLDVQSFASNKPTGDYELIPPVFIGENVRIGEGSTIGPFTVLDDNVTVAPSAKIRGSVILPNAYIGERSRLTGSLVCSGGSVKSSVSMFENSVVGSGAVINENAEIMPAIRVWPGKTVEASVRVSENLQYGSSSNDFFDDNGITGEAGIDLTPEFCAKLGSAIGSLSGTGRVGVASGGGSVARAFKSAFVAGVLSTGTQIWDFGEILGAQMAFASSFCTLPISIYIKGGPTCSISILGEGGLPVSRLWNASLKAF